MKPLDDGTVKKSQATPLGAAPLKNRVWKAAKKEGTVKCLFGGEADDCVECTFFLFIIIGGPQAHKHSF
jgi:hypothetical protein